MKDRSARLFATSLTTFLVYTAVANATLALLYWRGVERLSETRSIGERDVRVLARPLRIAVGDQIAKRTITDHLDRVGYFRIEAVEPGCYRDDADSVTIWSRFRELPNITIRWSGDEVTSIASAAGVPMSAAAIEPETLLTATLDHAGGLTRTSTDPLPLAALAGTPLLDAIIASEDSAFYRHHGIDFPRLASIPFFGGGASTITMQVARMNVLQDRSRTLERKLNEIGLAMAIDRVFSKDAILTAYANTVDLGARRGRPVHGFAAAAREFLGVRDVRALTTLQAATIVAMLNQPSRYLGDLHDGDSSRLERQRKRVLRLMHRNYPDRYSEASIAALDAEPVRLEAPAANDTLYRVSRHFVEYALDTAPPAADRVYLTLDPDLQRIAASAVAAGLAEVEQQVARAVRPRLQSALIAIDPASGEVLAMIGGRSYETSQFNRATGARRQVGSIMKPFDYLAAFERAATERISSISPATHVLDQPVTINARGRAPWTPANYDHNYAGLITWRRALAESRNAAAVKVAAWAGFDRVTALWETASGQRLPQIFPSIALGAIQATPAEVAMAYAAFAADGTVRPLETITRVVRDGEVIETPAPATRRVSRPETAATVREMLRAVLDEGTGRRARVAGLTIDAAGKTGTTDGLRDAWFAGFTADLLAVVWVGRDDDQPVGLTGSQAALPIWTAFMKGARQQTTLTDGGALPD